MKPEEAQARIEVLRAKIDLDRLDERLGETDAGGADPCADIIKRCRSLRAAIKKAGCVGREADPLLCQPLWDELNDAYEALHDCRH